MANNPFDQFDQHPAPSPGAAGRQANTFDQFDVAPAPEHRAAPSDYEGWDKPSAPPPAVPLANDPNYTYGSVVPLAKNNTTGALSLAVPEILRSPIRGMVEGGQEARGLRPVNDPAARSDITAAATTFGGARAGVGEPHPGAAESPKSPVRPVAVDARQAGYVLPPTHITAKPGLVANSLAGWSGKYQTWQAASERNQEITTNLAKQALGVPENTAFTGKVFNDLRAQAGQAYQAVASAVPTIKAKPDTDFQSAIQNLGGQNSQAALAFPKIVNNQAIKDLATELRDADEHPTGAWLELVKELRFNATGNLKAAGDPSKQALGLAQREAAAAIDDMMDRQIAAAGKPDVIDAYRQARKLIAKSYDVEASTNMATGDVNALAMARLADKGRPLTDQLRTIADTAGAFPKAMQSPSTFGHAEPWTAIDMFAGAGAALHGNPLISGALFTRPAARAAVLSGRMQNRLTYPQPSNPGPLNIFDRGATLGATAGMEDQKQ